MTAPNTQSPNLVLPTEISGETMDQIKELRLMRLELVNEQLRDMDQTLYQLTSRGLIDSKNLSQERNIIKNDLLGKKDEIEYLITHSAQSIHFSELELYLELLG